MQHDQLISFLLALAVLLGAATLLGRLAQRLGLPALVGELFAGIVCGKTIFGHLAPDAYVWLFTRPETSSTLQGYKVIATVLLLLMAGLEINVISLRRMAGVLVYTSLLGAAIPFVCGYGLGVMLPETYLPNSEQRQIFAIFLGIALAISALPVITRTLMDLGLLKTKIGTVVLSGAVVNDLIGWLCFGALVRAMQSAGPQDYGSVFLSLFITSMCMLFALAVARPLAMRWKQRLLSRDSSDQSSWRLGTLIAAALFGAVGMELLGVHAVFGGLIIGLSLGGAIDPDSRIHHGLRDCVNSLFSPVFFAMMALRHDVIAELDLSLVGLVIGVACLSKIAGVALGARLGGFAWPASFAVGFGMNSRGAMEILLASVAIEAGIIEGKMFVALILMAITTSLISGPAMSRVLRLRGEGGMSMRDELLAQRERDSALP